MSAYEIDDASERFSLLEMDPLPGQACKRCHATNKSLDGSMLCNGCYNTLHTQTQAPTSAVAAENAIEHSAPPVSAPLVELTRDLAIISESALINSSAQGIGSLRGGELRGVGFSSKEGYIQAIRNGVKAATHASYLTTLRAQYGMTSADIAELELPGPMAETILPVGAGIAHEPHGHKAGAAGIFDRPRMERAFVVGPKDEQADAPAKLRLDGKDLIAGAVAEGHGVIVSWGGTATTRGQILAALESVGLTNLAPNAASPEAHAGEVIERLNRTGYVVRKAPARKVGERVWTAASLNHTSQVGDSAGDVLIRFTLRGDTLTYDGPAAIGDAVRETFETRMAAERYKAGDITTWLGKVLRQYMRATRFGLGWYVPQRHAELTTQLCEALSSGFGSDWITGLPVASSDQLRKGIARGLIDEVRDLLHRLDVERATAAAAKDRAVVEATNKLDGCVDRASRILAQNELHKATSKRGDIGDDRIKTFLSELRTITERIVAYGRILGEDHLVAARSQLRDANVALETLRGEDHTGIRARFDALFEELAADDARKAGGAL